MPRVRRRSGSRTTSSSPRRASRRAASSARPRSSPSCTTASRSTPPRRSGARRRTRPFFRTRPATRRDRSRCRITATRSAIATSGFVRSRPTTRSEDVDAIGGSSPRMGPHSVSEVAGFRMTYGSTVAVDDVSFEVSDGEIFGLIGPNGAGKTTTMECVEGIRTPDRGLISVFGLGPFRDVYKLQDRIGVQLQQAQLQKRIKVWEAVHLWASLYRNCLLYTSD